MKPTTGGRKFISSISTVVTAVTNPPAGDAPSIPTLKLSGAACVGSVCGKITAHCDMRATFLFHMPHSTLSPSSPQCTLFADREHVVVVN